MSWNERRYQDVKARCASDIARNHKSAADYMSEYKRMIEKEDYEAAKAITEVLKPLDYDTSITHQHIKSLNKKP